MLVARAEARSSLRVDALKTLLAKFPPEVDARAEPLYASLAADAVLDLDPRTEAVTVTITKLRPPIPRDVEATAVRLHRTRP